ncbi:DNA cytosine methyltransferase [Paenibacillus hemerocallicola]|uniref:Cytosine-specific methyltransferase n=1 Tax=Paenibacillus hemerocallicola TaxID=1172614 RepID=A0A5C4T830_9BACL|nr:DNA cytosine methyltransferase [Paenibacillus hemerocallicola]TNJ64547.1 DNA cytosine methyltransferase [Paenibacillus hemerocallicola]
MKTKKKGYLTINDEPYESLEMLSISLFSGLLGLDLGLHAAGFECKVALDIDKDAAAITKLNFPELPYLTEDIRNITPEELMSIAKINAGELDLLAGGPPCQSFSKSGKRKGLDDERGVLFQHYIRLLKEIRPRAFLLENVRGILSSNKGEDWKTILQSFKDTGYTVYWKVLDAANYGVPQFRQRLFIVGFRDRIKYQFPAETHSESNSELQGYLPYVTVNEAIGDLFDSTDFPAYNGKYAHLLEEIPEGLNYSYYCKERGHPNPLFDWRSKFWYFLLKIDRDRPSLTIQANPGNNTGPFHWENRKLGISELKRLQTIPDKHKMLGSYMTNHRLIGNAVPPLLAKSIGKSIKEALKANILLSESEYEQIQIDSFKNTKVRSGRGSGLGKFEIINGNVVVNSRSLWDEVAAASEQ